MIRVSESPLIGSIAFSLRSSPQNRRAPAWDCRSVERLSSRMAAVCGRAPTPKGAQPFSSHCPTGDGYEVFAANQIESLTIALCIAIVSLSSAHLVQRCRDEKY